MKAADRCNLQKGMYLHKSGKVVSEENMKQNMTS